MPALPTWPWLQVLHSARPTSSAFRTAASTACVATTYPAPPSPEKPNPSQIWGGCASGVFNGRARPGFDLLDHTHTHNHSNSNTNTNNNSNSNSNTNTNTNSNSNNNTNTNTNTTTNNSNDTNNNHNNTNNTNNTTNNNSCWTTLTIHADRVGSLLEHPNLLHRRCSQQCRHTTHRP